MDAQPLLVVKPEDIVWALGEFSLYWFGAAALIGVLAFMVGEAFIAVGRWFRMRRSARPFAERVQASLKRHDEAAQLHLRCSWHLERRIERERIKAEQRRLAPLVRTGRWEVP